MIFIIKLEQVEKLISFYKEIHRKIEASRLKDIPGFLVVVGSGEKLIFYHKFRDKDGKIKRNYIKRGSLDFIRTLAQKSYFNKLDKLALDSLEALLAFKKTYPFKAVEEVYQNQSKVRKELTEELIPSRDQILNSWLNRPYIQNNSHPENLRFTTKNGEKVRSKTERYLADRFFDLKIPYKYECPFYIDERQVFYPDFTFLDPKTNKEIYWEHFGMMDSPSYADKAFQKIEKYAEVGISLGQNLIVTFESSSYTPSAEYINELLEDMLLVNIYQLC